MNLNSKEKALKIANILDQKKASRIEILEIKDLSIITDYFVICSGESTTQVKALAEHLEEKLSEEGIRPFGVEGAAYGSWILLDYGDVIVHIFIEEKRQYYDLERLWLDAPRIPLTEAILSKNHAVCK